jgi:hypothetical protein
MSDLQRGKVVGITFAIEYPDGSRKVTEVENPEDVKSIAFDQESIAPGDEGRFNVSETDWKQNPSMIIYPQVGNPGIPFCTHNGCST